MADDETESEPPSFEEIKREIDFPSEEDEQFRRDVNFALNILNPKRREQRFQEALEEAFEGRLEEVELVIGRAAREEDLDPEEQVVLAKIRAVLGVKGSNSENWTAREGEREQDNDRSARR